MSTADEEGVGIGEGMNLLSADGSEDHHCLGVADGHAKPFPI